MGETGLQALTAEAVIALLALQPHPEGGFFRETFREKAPDGGRGASTAIYFLLRAGELAFITRDTYHGLENASETETLVTIWGYCGASSLEDAGYIIPEDDVAAKHAAKKAAPKSKSKAKAVRKRAK